MLSVSRTGFLMLLFCLFSAVWAEEMELESGASLVVSRFDTDSEALVLWLPSERGFDRDFSPVAKAIAGAEQAVWVVDLHESYMEPAGRLSIATFDPQDIIDLIRKAGQEGYASVAIFTASRGTRLAIRVARLWQQQALGKPALLGIVAAYPNLIEDAQAPGEPAVYLPIARSYNLPFYLVQPEYSTKYAHAAEIVSTLKQGGSAVFMHSLPGVQGGFFIRTDDDVTEQDLEAKTQFPSLLKGAVALMGSQPHPKQAPSLDSSSISKRSQAGVYSGQLEPYFGDTPPEPIDLPSLKGGRANSSDWLGETVLLNVWASWCGPCVREIPSLARLQARMKGEPFRIVSVNIGESAERIRDFEERVPIAFPVLLDQNSHMARQWNVYAYPSNFLLDPSGKITHAYRGALEWDDEEVVQTIKHAIRAYKKPIAND